MPTEEMKTYELRKCKTFFISLHLKTSKFNQMEYKPRIADKMLAKKLASKGAILIEGPKWCGKTTTAEQQAKSILYMDNPVIAYLG